MIVGTSQTIAWIILIEKLADQVFGMLHKIVAGIFHEMRELKISSHNLVVYFLHIVSIDLDERIFARQEFIEDGPERP